MLKVPDATIPSNGWLTEFEDDWPYQVAPGDLYFARASEQKSLKRDPIEQYVAAPWPTDATTYAIVGLMIWLPVRGRLRRHR